MDKDDYHHSRYFSSELPLALIMLMKPYTEKMENILPFFYYLKFTLLFLHKHVRKMYAHTHTQTNEHTHVYLYMIKSERGYEGGSERYS